MKPPVFRRLTITAALMVGFTGCVAPVAPPRSTTGNPGLPWPATDALNRTLPVTPPTSIPTAGLRPNRTVGIFYFLTHARAGGELPNNIAHILARDPDILRKPDSPLWGPPRTPYYWAEPLYGYYHSMDPWVIRRHASLLADAGIDTVIFDTTNRKTYREVYLKICEVWTQIRREGGRTPQVCFMVNTKARETAQELYHDFYQPALYPDLWFRWQGKPLLICDPKMAGPEVASFFTLRKAHWPFTLVNTHNAWHWESTYPQVFSYDTDSTQPEQVNVAVAQNLRVSDGKVNNMSDGDSRGRSFHAGKKDPAPDAVNYGHNFAEQFDHAIKLDPPFLMVTGWNEWTAGKGQRPGRPVVFVDQYDQEYSRDIEPVAGLHQDNYYYQLVAGVRRYKGQPALPAASAPTTINLATGFDPWRTVAPDFTDHAFDNDHRNFGEGAKHYVNGSGRNDLTHAKIARDTTHVFFYARSRDPFPSATGSNGLILLIDIDQNRRTGWEGYDFVLNRSNDHGEVWLEKNAGGWNWTKVAKVEPVIDGAQLMVAVHRAALGLRAGDALTMDFKWWDHLQKPGDIMDVYLSGDAAPDGRFNYRYVSPN